MDQSVDETESRYVAGLEKVREAYNIGVLDEDELGSALNDLDDWADGQVEHFPIWIEMIDTTRQLVEY